MTNKLREIAESNGRERHGLSKTKIYKVWVNMIQRCKNPKNTCYYRYGGKGIDVCDEWVKFSKFFADMGRPSDSSYSLDRINNSKGYSKSNCRWVNTSMQNHNIKRPRSGKYRGVSKIYGSGIWASKIEYHGERIITSGHRSEKEAAFAYDFCALFLFGETAITNFRWSTIAAEKIMGEL